VEAVGEIEDESEQDDDDSAEFHARSTPTPASRRWW
jgi:hypothetical protein